MRRGFTKPFSNGRLGAEQREEANRIHSINYHLRNNEFEEALELAKKVTFNRDLLVSRIARFIK